MGDFRVRIVFYGCYLDVRVIYVYTWIRLFGFSVVRDVGSGGSFFFEVLGFFNLVGRWRFLGMVF